jgi:Fur family zinc uptake transcriptional regulator
MVFSRSNKHVASARYCTENPLLMNTVEEHIPDATHDHESCVADAVAMAEKLCRERGLRFTSIRCRVLELVWGSHRPIGAYDILEVLGKESDSAAPPTVYRALEFLIEAGLVHRLDSLNAFIGCPDPARRHAGQFLICLQCRTVTELCDAEIEELVTRTATRHGFEASRQMLEIEGLCNNCRTAAQSA